jgi:hypothetical protein
MAYEPNESVGESFLGCSLPALCLLFGDLVCIFGAVDMNDLQERLGA